MIVYVLERGEYSARHVVGVFSTAERAKEFAEEFASECGGDYNEPVAFDVDPPTVQLVRDGFMMWSVEMLRDGTVMDVRMIDREYWHDDRPVDSSLLRGRGDQVFLRAELLAKDADHAVKIANERRAMTIANGEWK